MKFFQDNGALRIGPARLLTFTVAILQLLVSNAKSQVAAQRRPTIREDMEVLGGGSDKGLDVAAQLSYREQSNLNGGQEKRILETLLRPAHGSK